MTAGDTRAVDVALDDRALTRDRLWGALLDRDEYAAAAKVFAALDEGLAPEDVLLDVIAQVQMRVGAEWAANRITVAQEHAATAINERVIAALAHHPACAPTTEIGRVTVACVDGEWHALPARLLAEVLRLRGWRIDFLGAQVPTPHLIAHVHQHGPDAVALSCSSPTRLPTAHAAITACQAAGVVVLAGGAAFGPDGRYARLLGADGWAANARAAADQLNDGLGRVGAVSRHRVVDDLPHLADQEYTMISGSTSRLVAATVADLELRILAMRGYTDEQRQHTTEDIAHLVEFLGTALYLDDDDLFTGFVECTADILTARGVPPATLPPALNSLAQHLQEFPRARRILRAALETLSHRETDPTPHS